MSKTIQVRVDNELKDSADMLFSSLGMDTSTAVRMFLVASTEANGIPFIIGRKNNRNKTQYETLMKEAGQDKSFLERTMSCDDVN